MEPQHSDKKRSALVPATVLPYEADRLSSSNRKRPRVWESHSTELATDVTVARRQHTILDVLNADCWRLVLDYVCIGDVVRSERVSSAWQRVVRDYLAGIHNYGILLLNRDCKFRITIVGSCKRYRYMCLSKELFGNMIRKMGPFCWTMFAVSIDMENLEVIAANCPNLKKLKLRLSPSQEYVQFGILNKCKQLKHLSLYMCTQQRDGYDNSLKEIFANENLEVLAIVRDKLVTGSFLTNVRTNLKTLILSDCDSLLIEHMRSAGNRLTGLTSLELNGNSISILQNSHLLLDETPNLERLCLEIYENKYHWRSRDLLIKLDNEVPTAISRLSRLRELRLWRNRAVTDEWLAIVARGCPALRSIDVGYTCVSGRGLRTLCRSRPALAELVVCALFVKEEDLETCARYCGGLELLDVSYCEGLTSNLPARLAWPRKRPLRLRISRVLSERTEVHFDGITLLWDKPGYNLWPD